MKTNANVGGRVAALLASLTVFATAHAGDAFDYRSNGECPPPPAASMTRGFTGWQVWAVWQCRPKAADRAARRHFDVTYSILDPLKYTRNLADFEAVKAAYKAGNTWGAQDLAISLRDTPITDPIFAESKKAAYAAILPKLIAVNVSVNGGKTCACDVKRQVVGSVTSCPLESNLTGPLVACRGQ